MFRHTSDQTCRKYVCVFGTILMLIVAGILIYVCIYITRSSNDITLHSMTNGTNHTLQMAPVTAKNVKLAAIAVNGTTPMPTATTSATGATATTTATAADDDDDDTATMIKAADTTLKMVTTPTLKMAVVPTFKKAVVPTQVVVPTLTQVTIPPKPIKKVIYIPENIVLTNITRSI